MNACFVIAPSSWVTLTYSSEVIKTCLEYIYIYICEWMVACMTGGTDLGLCPVVCYCSDFFQYHWVYSICISDFSKCKSSPLTVKIFYSIALSMKSVWHRLWRTYLTSVFTSLPHIQYLAYTRPFHFLVLLWKHHFIDLHVFM